MKLRVCSCHACQGIHRVLALQNRNRPQRTKCVGTKDKFTGTDLDIAEYAKVFVDEQQKLILIARKEPACRSKSSKVVIR